MVAKDYKKAEPARKRPPAQRRPQRHPPRHPWRWYVAGLASGVLLTWAVYNPEKFPEGLRQAFSNASPRKLVGRSTASTEKKAPDTRFEFYTMLPEMEVAVPEETLNRPAPRILPSAGDKPAATPPGATADTATGAGDHYLLQVGSFRNRADAERLKANLALLGLQASIQTVSIDGTQTWNRVRAGPYTGLAALKRARARLRENRYRSIVLKIRG